jgi:hypothetical protein
MHEVIVGDQETIHGLLTPMLFESFPTEAESSANSSFPQKNKQNPFEKTLLITEKDFTPRVSKLSSFGHDMNPVEEP